jgi:drug/metabolite transporter (DMT)-like permease
VTATTIATSSRRASIGYALVAGAACAWGFWPLFLRGAESYGPTAPELESAITLAVVTLASAPFVLGDRIRARGSWRGWAGVAWMGVADALNVVLFFRAYQMTSVAIAVLTHYLTPLFIAVLAPLVLREERDRRTTASVLVSFVGLVLLLAPWASGHRPGDLLGALAGAGSAVFYASNVLVNKRVMDEFSGSEMMFFHGVVATPLLFLIVPRAAWGVVDMRSVGVVVCGAAVCGGAAGLAFVWGLRRIRASHASTLTLLEPLVAVVVAAVAFGERLSAAALAGGALILCGAAVVVSTRARRAPG